MPESPSTVILSQLKDVVATVLESTRAAKRNHFSAVQQPKNVPQYLEAEVHSYLQRFERAAQMWEWPESSWPTLLQSDLTSLPDTGTNIWHSTGKP
ncbi:hypothetical protein Ahia01_000021100 [Argonauta hians]